MTHFLNPSLGPSHLQHGPVSLHLCVFLFNLVSIRYFLRNLISISLGRKKANFLILVFPRMCGILNVSIICVKKIAAYSNVVCIYAPKKPGKFRICIRPYPAKSAFAKTNAWKLYWLSSVTTSLSASQA